MNCGIVIVGRWQMFVAFVGNLCPQIYIPTNVYIYIYASICLIFFYKIKLATNEKKTQEKFGYPWILIMTPTIKNDSTVYGIRGWTFMNMKYLCILAVCVHMYIHVFMCTDCRCQRTGEAWETMSLQRSLWLRDVSLFMRAVLLVGITLMRVL